VTTLPLPFPRAGARRDRLVRYALRAAFLGVLLAAWQAAGDDSVLLSMPTVTRTLETGWELTESGEMLRGFAASNVAMALGYLLALAVAIPLGLAMGRVKALGQVARPFTTVLLAVPMIAMLPVIQAIFGPGLGARVVVVFIFAFVYIALNAEVGSRSVPTALREMAASFGASRWQQIRLVTLPHALPSIMAGARLGLGRAIAGMVLAELFLVSSGLGSMLSFYKARFNTGAVFAIVVVLILEGVVIMALARAAERRLTYQRVVA
jgi:ABC-type nitrate/sulfonate/bicarbonate transport system permease component